MRRWADPLTRGTGWAGGSEPGSPRTLILARGPWPVMLRELTDDKAVIRNGRGARARLSGPAFCASGVCISDTRRCRPRGCAVSRGTAAAAGRRPERSAPARGAAHALAPAEVGGAVRRQGLVGGRKGTSEPGGVACGINEPQPQPRRRETHVCNGAPAPRTVGSGR
eukprot:scaffold7246_cov410-Prasinococcus_capsulatus_cf.AAC.6